MDAKPILVHVARVLREQGLEAVLIGNSAAAIQGAPVTTMDIDFLIRKTPANIAKLKHLAKSLGAVVFTRFYPVSGLFRLTRDDDALQLDFMTTIHGFRSLDSVRCRATTVDFGDERLWVAALADIIASKLAAGRPRDRAVMYVLNAAIGRDAETELDLQDQIRRLLAKPPGERTHFLRRKIGITGSCL